jgi:hypothetical protein
VSIALPMGIHKVAREPHVIGGDHALGPVPVNFFVWHNHFVSVKSIFIESPINTTLYMNVSSCVHHIHYGMFRPVIATAIG